METSIVVDVQVVLKRIELKLNQLDVCEERVIDSFIKSRINKGRRKWLFFKTEVTKEMAEKMLDEPDGLFGTKRQYYTNWMHYERKDLNQIKKMCYDSSDGKITLCREDYDKVTGI